MNTSRIRALFVVAMVAALAGIAAAQVQLGTQKFGSFGGGEFDTVNLGNLDVHFTVPIIHKAGRGIPFNYDLSYDSSIYQIITVNGQQIWQPLTNVGGVASYWGWQGLGPVFEPYVGYTVTFSTGICGSTGQFSYQKWVFNNFVYYDTLGTSHPSNAGGQYVNSSNCGGFGPPNGAQPPGLETTAASDGSGYSINVSFGAGSLTASYVTTTSGMVLSVPFLSGAPTSSPYTAQDANGNKITFNNGVYTDTLGTVLTVTGAQPNPVTFTYTGPAGSQFYRVNFSSYNIKTAFNCTTAGIQDYTSPGSVNLVSSIALPDGSQYSFSYEDTPGNTGYKTGRISQVTLPTGGTISYSYTFSGSNDGINCSDGSTLAVQRTLSPGGMWQYTRNGTGNLTTTVTDPASNQTAINFEQFGLSLYETQRLIYQGSTSGTPLETDITCYNGQNVGTPASCYNTPITAQVTRITNFKYLPSASGLQSETDSTYDTFGLIQEVDEYDYGQGAVGGIIRKTITAYKAGLSNGIVDRPYTVTIKDSGNNAKALTTYGYDETTPLTPSGTTPQWVSVSGSRGNLTSVTAQANGTVNLYRKYTYYNTGMLATSTDVSTSSSTNGAQTTYTYDNTGTPSHSCGNSFVTSISEPVGSMSRSFTWDCNGGVLLSVTDENGKVSSTAYSGTNYTNVFWRPYSTTDEAGTTTDYFYSLTAATPPVEFQTESKYHTAFNSGNSSVDKVTTTDGFGRTLFSQTRQGPSASNYDTVATCYDNFGRVTFSSLPYSATLATSSSSCPYPANSNGTVTTYEAMGRTYQVTAGNGGQTTFTYNKNDTLEVRTTPTISKQSEFDALGRLKSVCEVTSGTTAWPSASCSQNTAATGYLTSYTYDVLGNRIGVVQNNQASGKQNRTFVYDMIGRLTSETNPETNNAAATYAYDTLSSDPSCGSITSAGNLLKTVDASGNVTCYSGYDALHRVGAVVDPTGTNPAKHFVYDAATINVTAMINAKTRLAEAYTCIGGCSSKQTDLGFSYTATGQQSDVWELTPHSGTNYYFHVTATPWPTGAVNTISNLVGLPTITYGADGEGRVSSVSASSGQSPLASTVGYDAASHVTSLTYGSSDSDAFTFYATTGRMHTYTYTMGATPKTDSGTLNWNTNGLLQSLTITDQINSANTQTCNYTHDDLGRIASGNCGTATWNQNFSYDPFGNITKTVPNGSTGTPFGPNYDYTNYTNRMTSSPYTYNGNAGAITADTSHSYSWDTATRLSKVDAGASNGVCLTYDALNRVVEQAYGASCATSPTSTTEIVYSPAGAKLALMNGSSLVKAFVGLPGGAQAVYNGSGLLYYRHPDWLGSSRLATTPSRTCYWDIAYAPFGENYAPPASGCVQQDLNFTGQNQDTESSVSSGGQGGLYDFMFRKHSPVQGRWLSPDPAGLAAVNPSDPQTWNRYAYLVNRPMNAVDALGMDGGCDPFIDPVDCPCDPNDPSCGGGCDPDDPICGGCPPDECGSGYGPPPPPVTFTIVPQREGGVWPDNESLGLPIGLNTAPLGADYLLGLLPNLNCGGVVFTFSILETHPDTKKPCPIIPLLVFVAAAGDSSDKKKPPAACSWKPGDRPAIFNWCASANEDFIEHFDCTGTVACCQTLLGEFTSQCISRGRDQYETQGEHMALYGLDYDCCKKRKK
jgi:RHS repeat-associated protein